MKTHAALFLAGLSLATAGCTTATQSRQAAPSRVEPAQRPSAAEVTPGLNEKEPDTCKARPLLWLIGQPAGNLRTVQAPGPVRLIGPDTMYDQEEYRSNRINAFTDGAGVIRYLSCG